MKRIWADLKGRSGAILLAAFLLLAGNYCMARVPALSGGITDSIISAARS